MKLIKLKEEGGPVLLCANTITAVYANSHSGFTNIHTSSGSVFNVKESVDEVGNAIAQAQREALLEK